jgi:hypothetical protein
MPTSKQNEIARRNQIQNMLKLIQDKLKITTLSESEYSVNAKIPTLYTYKGNCYFGNEADFLIKLPPGFPLFAKPLVEFKDPLKRPVSPNISNEGVGCIGNWTEYSTLNQVIRKMLLEAIFDENTINVRSAYPYHLSIYNKLLENPSISFPLMSLDIIYQWIPLMDGEIRPEKQPVKRTAKLKE